MSGRDKVGQSPQSRTFKTEHTFASNQDMGFIEQQNFDQVVLISNRQANYDQQFQQIYQQIVQHAYFSRISKHEKIRINKWLTKLANISTNDLWKKNRNNYIKLVRLMFDCETIIAPFLMMPPDRDLHKLTNHEMNVIVTQVQKLLNQKQGRNQLKTSEKQKVNKISWTQQSAYVDHHSRSQDRSQQPGNGLKKTSQSNYVAANFSKFSEDCSAAYQVPPRYPSTTKNKLAQQQKSTNQCYFNKQPKINGTNNQNFMSKQKQLTFESGDAGQGRCLETTINHSSERTPAHLQTGNYETNYLQEDFNIRTQQVIDILKCGFRILQNIPINQLQSNSYNQIKALTHLLSQNELLKEQLSDENVFLKNVVQTDLGRKVQIGSNNKNNSTKGKVNQKKKIKLTLLSQPTSRV